MLTYYGYPGFTFNYSFLVPSRKCVEPSVSHFKAAGTGHSLVLPCQRFQ